MESSMGRTTGSLKGGSDLSGSGDVAGRSFFPGIIVLSPQIEALDFRVAQKFLPGPGEAVSAQLQHIATIGHGEGLGGVLFHNQHRISCPLHIRKLIEDMRYKLRGESQRGVVQEEELWRCH